MILVPGIILLFVGIIIYNHFTNISIKNSEPTIKLYLHNKNRVINLSMEAYVCGVVAAEMPASFAVEALKAQALCARTYAFKKLSQHHKYPLQADLSDDANICQVYISWQQFSKRHPADYEILREKIEQVVSSTRGEIIIYNNQPIDALYHSTCGGRTENASDVWQADIPYLKSVECEYCKASKYYETEQVFSYQDLKDISGLNLDKDINIEITETSRSGRAKELQINGNSISAAKFRKLLKLPSTYWELKVANNSLYINSRGYGHGVGMCQYGANGMALDGKLYKEILAYYYKGTEIYSLNY